MSIGVSQIVDGFRVPLLSDTEKFQGQEPIFSHDHEVHEESSCGLNHSDLAIRHRNQPVCRIKAINSVWGVCDYDDNWLYAAFSCF